ncbi:hypothetical protein [Tenacibaculum aestuariivivum]|uniref:hypothetical protein n=1 Tax=Tenacibaculum aestuariivivum TaxID=2006131 RepID=UPI003AB69494
MSNFFDKRHGSEIVLAKQEIVKYLENERIIPVLFIGLAIFSFDISYLEGFYLTENLGIKIQLFSVSILYLAVYLIKKELIYKFMSIGLILFSVRLGDRTILALFFCIYAFLVFYRKKKISVGKVFKMSFFGITGLFLIVISKRIYSYLLVSDISTLFYFIANGGIDFNAVRKGMEFLSTQYIFQAIVDNQYYVGVEHFFYSFLALLPIPLSAFDYSSSMYNTLFQNDLFPGLTYRMAFNPWAEGYSYFGFSGLIIMPLIYVVMIYKGQSWFCKTKIFPIKIFLLTFLALSSFYFHRNSLGTHFAFTRNFLYPILVFVFLKSILPMFRKSN